MSEDIIYRLRKRAEIRRQITTRKSVQEGKPDRIADLLEEAANEITLLRMDVVVCNTSGKSFNDKLRGEITRLEDVLRRIATLAPGSMEARIAREALSLSAPWEHEDEAWCKDPECNGRCEADSPVPSAAPATKEET